MKKKDWILVAAVLLTAGILGFGYYMGSSDGHYVVVSVDGEEYGHYALDKEQTIDINGTNQLEIKNGKASMITADCPDKLCVQMTEICEAHELIVCLPNKVTVEAFGE